MRPFRVRRGENLILTALRGHLEEDALSDDELLKKPAQIVIDYFVAQLAETRAAWLEAREALADALNAHSAATPDSATTGDDEQK